MSILDVYVLRLFIKILLVAFCSLAGIFVVFDAVGSLDDFLAVNQQRGNLLGLLSEYYGPQTLSIYNQISPLLSLMACIFTVTFLQRSNEMTAIRAAGISQMRVVRPMIIASIVLSGFAALNRELVIPKYRDQITRKIQDWSGERPEKVQPRYDHDTDLLFNGRQLIVKNKQIISPNFRLHRPMGDFERRLVAGTAYHLDATSDHPAGYLLVDVTQPPPERRLPSFQHQDATIIYSPADHSWLGANQLFVASDVEFDQLHGGTSWRHYASVAELWNGLWNRSLDYGADVKVAVHARFVQPLLDFVLLVLGLPLILSRNQRNVFVAAGMCILMVIAFYVVVLAAHALGGSTFLLSPAAAAWSPLFIFGPIAYTVAKPLWC